MPPERPAPSKASGSEPKRQRKMLTTAEKVKLLDMLKEGRSFAAVGHHYSINESTVRYIKKDEKNIKKTAALTFNKAAKRVVTPCNKIVYIGSVDIPRPNSRAEIVAAMRKTRYEFKIKAMKKKKIILTVSVDGVKVTLRKKKKSQFSLEESKLVLMHHPIYRIFYVSHDSQDLQIWSYIVREGPSNMFRCNVFKAYKKSQAMNIVRTIGQAFEVCHKLGDQCRPNATSQENASDKFSGDNERNLSKNKDQNKELNNRTAKYVEVSKQVHKPAPLTEISVKHTELSKQLCKPSPPTELNLRQTEVGFQVTTLNVSVLQNSPASPSDNTDSINSTSCDSGPLSLSQHHHLQLLRQQLEQQQQQTQVALAQVHLLKDQLSAETSARIEAQARAHQLLLYNKDLLDHVSLLVSRVQQLEVKITGLGARSSDQYHASSMILANSGTSSSRPASFALADSRPINRVLDTDTLGGTSMLASMKVAGLELESPDSGNRDMSSDSLSYSPSDADASTYINPYDPSVLSNLNDSGGIKHITATVRPSCLNLSSPCNKSRALQPVLHTCDNQQARVFSLPNTPDAHICKSSHSDSSQNSPYKNKPLNKIKLTSPLSSPSSSSNSQRFQCQPSMPSNNPYLFSSVSNSNPSTPVSYFPFSAGRIAPKLEPPPKFGRASRQAHRWERGSWCEMPVSDRPRSLACDRACITRSNSGGLVNRSHSINNGHSATAEPCFYTDNRNNAACVTPQRQKLELRVNDLSSPSQLQQQTQYPQQQESEKWRNSVSYSLDENTDYSQSPPPS